MHVLRHAVLFVVLGVLVLGLGKEEKEKEKEKGRRSIIDINLAFTSGQHFIIYTDTSEKNDDNYNNI